MPYRAGPVPLPVPLPLRWFSGHYCGQVVERLMPLLRFGTNGAVLRALDDADLSEDGRTERQVTAQCQPGEPCPVGGQWRLQ